MLDAARELGHEATSVPDGDRSLIDADLLVLRGNVGWHPADRPAARRAPGASDGRAP